MDRNLIDIVARQKTLAGITREEFSTKQKNIDNISNIMMLRQRVIAIARIARSSFAPVSRSLFLPKTWRHSEQHAADDQDLVSFRKLKPGLKSYATNAMPRLSSWTPVFVTAAGIPTRGPLTVGSARTPAAVFLSSSKQTLHFSAQRHHVISKMLKGIPWITHNERFVQMATAVSSDRGSAATITSKATAVHHEMKISNGMHGIPRKTLPSIAPISRAPHGGRSSFNHVASRRQEEDAPFAKTKSMDENGLTSETLKAQEYGKTMTIYRQQLGNALQELLNRQGRLPPSGSTAFDPRLTPAWPGQKLPG